MILIKSNMMLSTVCIRGKAETGIFILFEKAQATIFSYRNVRI